MNHETMVPLDWCWTVRNLLHQFSPRLRHVSLYEEIPAPQLLCTIQSLSTRNPHTQGLFEWPTRGAPEGEITTWVFCRLSQLLQGKLDLQSSLLCNVQFLWTGASRGDTACSLEIHRALMLSWSWRGQERERWGLDSGERREKGGWWQ